MNLLLIIICIILIYTYCYFIFPDDLCILQCSLNEFEFKQLYRRQPLVIEDYVANVSSIIDLWFSSNIVQNVLFDSARIWNLNVYKYLFIYALEDTEILLCPATTKVLNDTPDAIQPVISIVLKQSQSVIVPYRWYYNIKNVTGTELYGIHDYVTYCVDIFI